jgi:hypothetical protein
MWLFTKADRKRMKNQQFVEQERFSIIYPTENGEDITTVWLN